MPLYLTTSKDIRNGPNHTFVSAIDKSKRMKLLYSLTVLLISTLLLSCTDDNLERVEVVYDTVPFERIRLETVSDIKVYQSNEYRVVVEGERRDADRVHVKVSNNLLVVEEKGNIIGDQIIRVYLPTLRRLESEGTSWVYGETQFVQLESIDLANYGTGEVDLYVDIDKLNVELFGTGAVRLEGLADNVDYYCYGTGRIKAFSLITDFADVRIQGTGSAEVFVDQDLDVIITGSGNVYYKGHPDISSVITGTGKVIDAN